jgi:hypothetical protein
MAFVDAATTAHERNTLFTPQGGCRSHVVPTVTDELCRDVWSATN